MAAYQEGDVLLRVCACVFITIVVLMISGRIALDTEHGAFRQRCVDSGCLTSSKDFEKIVLECFQKVEGPHNLIACNIHHFEDSEARTASGMSSILCTPEFSKTSP